MFRHIPLKNFVRTSRFPRNTLISIKLHFSVGKPTCQQFQAEPSHRTKLVPERVLPNCGACFPSPGCGVPPGCPVSPRGYTLSQLGGPTKLCPSCRPAGEDLDVLLIAATPWCNFPAGMGCSSQGLIPHPRGFPSPGTPRDLCTPQGRSALGVPNAWNGQESPVRLWTISFAFPAIKISKLKIPRQGISSSLE